MKRQIYFCGSICGGRGDLELYRRIIEQLEEYGEVLTKHIAYCQSESYGDERAKFIHDRDIAWLEKCDVVIAEVTTPSLGVGYEVGRAVVMDKRILILFRPETGRNLSAMLGGCVNGSSRTLKHYQETDLPAIFKELFETL